MDSARTHAPMRGAALRLLPFLSWLPRLTPRTLRADLIAALTGTVIVLPQGVAYALIAGLPPEYGLYTAIVPAIVAALFGSSCHSITGPTAANSIVVLATVSAIAAPESGDYIGLVLTLSFLVGALQLLFGLLRLGRLVNFVSDTVIVGFTAGAAALIAASQLKHVLGIELAGGLSFVETLAGVSSGLHGINSYALLVAAAALGTGLLVQALRPRWPALLIAMLASSALALLLASGAQDLALVGALSGQFPPLSGPDLSLQTLRSLAPGALALAILALVQATSSARAVATRSGQQIDGNQEVIGQGLANLTGSFFSSYASSGSFTRSGANYDAGALTPMAAVFAAIGVLLVLVLAPGITRHLAMPAMGGIVLLVAWNLIDIARIRRIVRLSRREAPVLLVTFLATLFLDLGFAIYAGVLLSLVLFLHRTARPQLVGLVPLSGRPGRPLRNAGKRGLPECPRLKVLRIDGALFFGAIDHVQGSLRRLSDQGYRHVLLVGSGVSYIDAAGAEMVAAAAQRFRTLGGGLYACGFKDPAADLLRHPLIRDKLAGGRLFANPDEAITEIFTELDLCDACQSQGLERCAVLG